MGGGGWRVLNELTTGESVVVVVMDYLGVGGWYNTHSTKLAQQYGAMARQAFLLSASQTSQNIT